MDKFLSIFIIIFVNLFNRQTFIYLYFAKMLEKNTLDWYKVNKNENRISTFTKFNSYIIRIYDTSQVTPTHDIQLYTATCEFMLNQVTIMSSIYAYFLSHFATLQ